MRRLLLASLLALSAPAWGTTYFVRPGTDAQGNALTYGGGTGASYANAWTPATITWASAAGNVLCFDNQATFYERVVIGADNVTMRGCDPSGNPAYAKISSTLSLDGSASYSAATTWTATGFPWSLVSGEVWKKSTSAPVNLLIEDGAYLTPVQAGADEASTAALLSRGQFSVLTGTPNTIYYRASDGNSPSVHALRGNNRTLDGAGNPGIVYCSLHPGLTIDHFDIRHHRTSGVTTAIGAALSLSACNNVSIDYLSTSYNLAGIGINGGSNITLGRNVVADHNLGTGLAMQGVAATLDNVLINGGTFTNTSKDAYYTISDTSVGYSGDGDGIGIGQDGGTLTNIRIIGVYSCFNGAPDGIVDTGGAGIYVGTSNAMTAQVSIYRSRTCYNHGTGWTMGNKWVGGQIVGNLCEENSRGGNSGTDLFGCVVQTNSASYVSAGSVVANNSFVNNRGSSGALEIVNATLANTIVLKNNLFAGNTGADLTFQTPIVNVTWDNVFESNNLFYRKDTATAIFSSGNAKTCAQITSGSWGTVSANTGDNDQCADPRFIDGGGVYGYVASTTSPAYRAGATLGAFQDYFGRAFGTPPSIGAFEYGGGMLTPTRAAVARSLTTARNLSPTRTLN